MRRSFAILCTAAVLAVAACGGGGNSGGGGAPKGSIDVKLTEFKFAPSTITAKAGSVTFFLENNGTTSHDMVIFDGTGKQVGASSLIQAGDTDTLTVTLDAGTYTFKCTQPGHADSGMKGTISVTG